MVSFDADLSGTGDTLPTIRSDEIFRSEKEDGLSAIDFLRG